jgi:hypothetical protein
LGATSAVPESTSYVEQTIGNSSAGTSRITRKFSRQSAVRESEPIPNAGNATGRSPDATPRTSRRLVSRSTEAAALAKYSGWRNARTIESAASAIERVWAAIQLR